MKKLDKIEVLGNGVIQVREIEVFELSDGTTRDVGFFRYALDPTTDLNTIEDPKVKAIAEVTWTADVISDYVTFLAE